MVDTTLASWLPRPWHEAPLVAIDLEGTGAQDRADEAILEIAAIQLVGGEPDLATAYTTLVDPRRPVPRRPWISPGLTDDVLADAPDLALVEPDLAARLNGRILVGHNVGVDWRLLHRRCPSVTPMALLDTYKLAKGAALPAGRGLAELVATLGLTDAVDAAAPDSRPHRALWDTTAAGLLLAALIARRWPTRPTLAILCTGAQQPLERASGEAPPDTLF